MSRLIETTPERGATHQLTLPEELVLMLLNEETGYFHQIAGWDLNCAIAGAAIAELSLISRIDTDLNSLFLLDDTETGHRELDGILEEIADEPASHNVQYWVERLAPRSESIIDSALGRLVDLEILDHHEGDYWTLSGRAWSLGLFGGSQELTAAQFVKARIANAIFDDTEVPSPRDIIIIALINTCDLFRFIFQLDEEAEERIELLCKVGLIPQAISQAVSESMVGPLLRRPSISKQIPVVPLRKAAFNRHLREGNLNAFLGHFAKEYGPVYQLRPPFQKPITVLAGAETNYWVHRHGRNYLRARDYLEDFEKVYGASGILPALDGADHFRFRKSMNPAYSRSRLELHLDTLYSSAREYMSDWSEGESLPAERTCRRMINAQVSPIMISVDSQDLIDDLVEYKTRALTTHVVKVLPKFLLHTPGMKRRRKSIFELLQRVQSVHTPAQRSGCPRDFADDLLSLHTSDPQFLPESNLRFVLSAPLIASVYLGDALGFAVYAMASQPEFYNRIRSEADALFADGDPDREALTPEAIDITRRFVLETLRLYAIVPMSLRTVMNTCVVEGYELAEGSLIHIAQGAAHYMEDVFPEPTKFDIDRYLPPRNEHHSSGYAPFGLGTHTCLGSRWMELHLALNLLLIAHHFTLELPANHKFKISMFPSLSVGKKLKFRVAEKRREIPV